MLPQRFLWTSAGFLLALVVLVGVAAYAAPSEQSTLTTDQLLLATQQQSINVDATHEQRFADQETQIVMLWGTLDSYAISTEVATFTATGTPVPASPTRTNTATSTQTPTATLQPSNTPLGSFPTPTQEDISTPADGDLVVFYANATSGNVNIRACAGTACPVIGSLPEHGTLGLCAGTAQVVGAYEFWQIATPAGAPQRWIAVQNVSNGALLMASLNHEQISTDTDCEE